MCGIVGYVGNKDSLSIILKGLKRLEYRGYDSSGLAISDGNTARLCKSKGKINLKKNLRKIKIFMGLLELGTLDGQLMVSQAILMRIPIYQIRVNYY